MDKYKKYIQDVLLQLDLARIKKFLALALAFIVIVVGVLIVLFLIYIEIRLHFLLW